MQGGAFAPNTLSSNKITKDRSMLFNKKLEGIVLSNIVVTYSTVQLVNT